MDTILEIIKITIPAAIVYLTVKSLFGQYLSSTIQMERQKVIRNLTKDQLGLKVQAMERLIMFCERANPYQMRMRLEVPDMTGKQLATSMVIAINQEYDHNVSQQLYTTETLWKIISTAKDQLVDIILHSSEDIIATDGPGILMQKMDQYFSSLSSLPMDKVKSAIKNEFDGIMQGM